MKDPAFLLTIAVLSVIAGNTSFNPRSLLLIVFASVGEPRSRVHVHRWVQANMNLFKLQYS